LIVGAGVHSKKDLKVARKLGAKGVLIASAVVLAKDPEKKLEELI
jgi:triosephosphate isomerase